MPNESSISQQDLDAFLVDNPDLEALERRLSVFNSLDILGITEAELRHSNILAWLFDPSGSHGLGDLFLRRFLSRLLRDVDGLDSRLSPSEVELMDLGAAEVRREWQHLDLLVVGPGRAWVLAIENKIRARESRGQLIRYAEALEREFDGASLLKVFLTLEGDLPTEEGQLAGFRPLSWIQVGDLLAYVMERRGGTMPSEAHVLLRHYLDAIRRLTMQDTELISLCRRIYKQHRRAIEAIMEYGATNQVLEHCHTHALQWIQVGAFERQGSRLWLVPEWLRVDHPRSAKPWGFLLDRERKVWNANPLAAWFTWNAESGKLQLSLEVGPFQDPEDRWALMAAFEAAGLKISKSARTKEMLYTRVFTAQQQLPRDDDGDLREDYETVGHAARELWRKLQEKQGAIQGVVAQIFPASEAD